MTKFRYILAILLSTCASALFAQKHFAGNISIGAKCGATLSRINFSPGVKQSWNMGQTIGATFRYIEEKNFGLILEANFTKAGWKENFEDPRFNYERDITYIQIPILTHIYFGSSKMKGFVNLGPQLGYAISESTSSDFDYENFSTIPDFPADNRHTDQLTLPLKNKFDYGLAFGAGAEFVAKRRHSFTLEGRLYYGLGNIFGSQKKDTFSASSNMSVMVTLGYSFRIK